MSRQTYDICLKSLFSLLLLLFIGLPALGQSASTAAVTGIVQDTTDARIPNAQVNLINTDTGTVSNSKTNKDGIFAIPSVLPGHYSLQVACHGFDTARVTGITLNVGDNKNLGIRLKVGSSNETVTVDGSGITINTTDASVGTVVDRKFVEEIPLNGRSFQSLILLSPGVVTASPQGSDNGGEFSVNGQRTTANNFTLDGASAMNSAGSGGSGVGSTGSTSNSTALGTTQAIISIDALQEFRIATSTYSAQFGRQPGAQITFTSRSGTNQYHGTAFEYLRNYAFDANDWFNDYSTPPLPKPQERQNDFGGVLGGPLSVPWLFSGKDRAFFFFSYEGLRLEHPDASSIYWVPSNGTYNTSTAYLDPRDKDLRGNASDADMAQALNGFPLPNCSTAINPQCVDYGDGLSPFIVSLATPSSLDSLSGRIDFQPSPGMRLFARYSDTESSSNGLYYGSSMRSTVNRNRIYLLGADSTFRGSMVNQLRLQYSVAYARSRTTGQSVGGSQPMGGPVGPNLDTIEGLPPVGGKTAFELTFGHVTGTASPHLFDLNSGSRQFQPNIVDTLNWAHGRHMFKAGVDLRQTTQYLGYPGLSYGPLIYYTFETAEQVRENAIYSATASNLLRQDPVSKNLGVFIQDEWRLKPRVSLSLGLRWDLNPSPSISGAQQYTYTGNISNPSSLQLSRLGAPLYKTTYTNFAPRLGTAIVLNNESGHELVLRAGGGLFFDTGQSSFIGTVADGVSLGATNVQLFGTAQANPHPWPIPADVILQPVPKTPVAPYTLQFILAPNFTPPSTVQWSASLEQAFGTSQSVTLGYVGSAGRKLSVFKEYSLAALNPLFKVIEEYENGPGSVYNSLQLQYKRQMLKGLQVVASYTWAHAIDSASTDYSANGLIPPQRGNSDHDIRHNFTTALVYGLPMRSGSLLKREVFGNWNEDLTFITRSAFPVEPLGTTVVDPLTGNEYPARLDYNGMNPYVNVRGIPGGRQFNPAVFSLATASAVGTAPRNFLRGFGELSTDLAIQRVFPLYEGVRLQFRAEAFNITNRPNFGAIDVACGAKTAGTVCNNPLLGQATATLANSLGGLSSLYQQGGPRSLQFALKLQF